jgi:hypothetical protein
VTRCKHHLIFRTPLRAVASTPAHLFGPTSAGCIPPKGASQLQPHALLLSSRGTNQNFGLLTSNFHLRLLYARTSDVLFKTLHVFVTFRAITYMLCAIGQCGLLGFPYRTSTSPRTKVPCGGRGYPGIREDK